MTTARPHLGRIGATATAVVLLVGTVGLTWWSTVTPYGSQTAIEPITVPAPASAVSYVCPSGPENTLGAVDVGQEDANTLVSILGQGATATLNGEDLVGDVSTSDAVGGIASLIPASSDDAASISGLVTTSRLSGDLRGLTAAPCMTSSAMSWIVGSSGQIGSSSQLRLTNPGVTTVTATVTLYGSTGAIAMPSGGKVIVPAGETVDVLLESSAVGDGRLAVSIESDGGSLVPSLVSENLDGETPAGIDILTSGAGTGTKLMIPGVILDETSAQASGIAVTTPPAGADSATAAGQQPRATTTASPSQQATPESQASASASPIPTQGAEESQAAVTSRGLDATEGSPVVRIVNPHQAQTTVSITLIGPDGAEPLQGAQEVSIDPQTVIDISLNGVPAGAYGIEVSADRSVAAAARLVRTGSEYPAGSGKYVRDIAWVQAQQAEASRSGSVTVPGVSSQSVSSTMVLTNAGDRAATLVISPADGDSAGEGQGVKLSVPAHSTIGVDLASSGLPGSARALAVTSPDGSDVYSAVVMTMEDPADPSGATASQEGDTTGTLIAVVPTLPDASVSANRALLLR